MESDEHKRLKKLALYWLKEKVTDLVGNEVKLFVNRQKLIADAVGLNLKRKEIRFIEVKVSKKDLLRDDKLFDDRFSYAKLGHYAYVMCPKGILEPDDIPDGYGLLAVDEFDKIEILKKPVKNVKSKTTFDTVLKRTARALTNEHLFKEENTINKDHTGGLFSKNAKLQLISVNCSSCKKRNEQLIKIDTKVIKCNKRGCNQEIDLEKSKVRIITGFNNTFIKKFSSLIDDTE